MKKILALTMVSLIALNACGNIDKEKLGLTRKAPNENLVKVRPPLSLPPEYDYSPAKQAQKNMFKAPQASYTVLQQPVSLEPEKAEPEEAPRKYQTNAMRKSGASVKTTGLSSAEQAFVSQIKANQQAYQKQEAAAAAKAVVESKPDEPDIRALAAEELKNHSSQVKTTTIVKPAETAAAQTRSEQKTTTVSKTVKAKPVTSKKYSAPQYQKKTSGKRSPLRPLPKTRAATSSDGMSAGEKALINHFDNQSYMSDTVN